jgi:GT2 family glycosyltransferase
MPPCCPPTRVDVRELLPDWLLPPAYAFRRGFLPRHARFQLTRDQDGRFRTPGGLRLPHGRVSLRLLGWPAWETLELEGDVLDAGSSVPWASWIEYPDDDRALEIELPYRLRELVVRLRPDPEAVSALAVEMNEIGLIRAIRDVLSGGRRELLGELRRVVDGGGSARARLELLAWTLREGVDISSYARWLRTFEVPSATVLQQARSRALSSGLRVSVVTAPRADEAEFSAQLPGRVEVVRSLSEATGEIVVPLGPGVHLAPHALCTVVLVFQRRPELAMLHADDDRLELGRRSRPDFKPVVGPELLQARNPFRGLVAVRRSEMPNLDGVTVDAGRYAWALACIRAFPAHRVRRLPVVLATLDDTAVVDEEGERIAVEKHLHATGTAAEVLPGLAPGLRQVRYRLPVPAPRVTLVVPTRNARALVETCVRSVRRITRYPSYEIHLVDNGSDDPDALAAFEAFARTGDVVLHRDPRPFNFAALNNAAVGRTDAELVCLLNNDVEALHPEWLAEMVAVALQPGVGAVGAKLFYPDGRIQHGGVLVGVYGAADHAYAGAPGTAPGHAQQLLVRREVSAVTAACLVVRRALYLEVGGMDEESFPVSFNDVDFCLKLRERGYRNVWTPHARLVHHESASRGDSLRPEQKARADREVAALRSRWASALREDPYYSPNLSLSSKVPRLAWPPRERRPWSF